MHVERLDWLARNPRYAQRFAHHVGQLCRDMPNKAVAEREHLHDSTVKDLDQRYLQAQVARAGMPAVQSKPNIKLRTFIKTPCKTCDSANDCTKLFPHGCQEPTLCSHA